MRLPSLLKRRPLLSVIVIFYRMAREAPRTLYSLSRKYQQGIDDLDYEVIALDHAPSPPLDPSLTEEMGEEFIHRRVDTGSPSPVNAINDAVKAARGHYVVINIDGARILSPGMLAGIRDAVRLFDNAFVHSLGFHLGPGLQNETMLEGYDQTVEDKLLDDAGWKSDGYRLFEVSVPALSSSKGGFGDISESNCFSLSRKAYLKMGGFNPGFQLPGGGLCNLDFFRRAMTNPDLQPVRLLGEATFHQFHGGVATNVPLDEHPFRSYQKEYMDIYRERLVPPKNQSPVYIGNPCSAARHFLSSKKDD